MKSKDLVSAAIKRSSYKVSRSRDVVVFVAKALWSRICEIMRTGKPKLDEIFRNVQILKQRSSSSVQIGNLRNRQVILATQTACRNHIVCKTQKSLVITLLIKNSMGKFVDFTRL